MKLLRWAVAGASVYGVYRYSIGKKSKGEDVFVSPDREIAKLSENEPEQKAESATKAKKSRGKK